MTDFDDILDANTAYAADFPHAGVTAPAARGLAVLTCMDSRIDPLRAFGLEVGDFKMLRNAGGQLSEDMQRDIVLASHLLNVKRVLIMPHTKCAMASADNAGVTARILEEGGPDCGDTDWHTVADQRARLEADVASLRADPRLHEGVVVVGGIYDVDTGKVELLVT